MGHIKEPEGVDFVINSRPLTKKEEEEISEYIRAYKAKNSNRNSSTRVRRVRIATPVGPLA